MHLPASSQEEHSSSSDGEADEIAFIKIKPLKYNFGPTCSEEPPAAAKKQLPIPPPVPPSTDSTLAASSGNAELSPKKNPAEAVKLDDEDSNDDEAREEEGEKTQETKEQEQEKAETASE